LVVLDGECKGFFSGHDGEEAVSAHQRCQMVR
jgi:hypothetical protein